MVRITTEEFITRSTQFHGDRFDYSKSKFIASNEKIAVVCKIHGEFLVSPHSHMMGTGCANCSKKAKKTTESFIADMKVIHDNKFDYSNVTYINSKTPVHVVCDKGHSFWPTPNNHSRGSGCPTCTGTAKQNQMEFIDKCISLHGDRYDYSFVKYMVASKPIDIICREHGIFTQLANSHKLGQGCPKCSGMNKTTEDFIKEAVTVHGDKYDYSKVVYVGSKSYVNIICNTHGVFSQSPNSHLLGRGCGYCGGNVKLTTEQFINKSKVVHGELYDYSKTVYGSSNTESVTIICKEHGEFLQRPMDHLEGCGCTNCTSFGGAEQELRDYVESLGVETTKDKIILEGKEIDIFIPTHNIGFEFNGLFWHSEKRAKKPKIQHKYKTDLARTKGVKLIHIYEDDWEYKKDIVKSIIRNAIGFEDNKIFARKCKCSVIPIRLANELMDKHHIQGKANGIFVSLGLFSGDKLISVMQFSTSASVRGKCQSGVFELVRFVSKTNVVGGASKLFSYFKKTYSPLEVISYSDNDMFDGNVYTRLNFVNISNVPPDYKIIEGNRRKHKSNYRKSVLAKRFPNEYIPELSEHENCFNLKLYRIYNSGLKKWRWQE